MASSPCSVGRGMFFEAHVKFRRQSKRIRRPARDRGMLTFLGLAWNSDADGKRILRPTDLWIHPLRWTQRMPAKSCLDRSLAVAWVNRPVPLDRAM